jgi:DNA-binding IscR family transcriptional regulator
VAAGLLATAGRPGGGHRLARPPRNITPLEVVEAIHGPVRGDVPRWTTEAAGVGLDGRLLEVCGGAADVVRRQLRRVTVADLANGEG